jgi:hypothetical protein
MTERRTTALERGEHGSHTAYALGCRCPPCRRAQSRYARTRWAAASVARTGSARWKVDAGPLVVQLDALKAAGWRLYEVAAAADVPRPTLVSVRQAYRRRRRRRCWNTTAAAVLALDPAARP